MTSVEVIEVSIPIATLLPSLAIALAPSISAEIYLYYSKIITTIKLENNVFIAPF